MPNTKISFVAIIFIVFLNSCQYEPVKASQHNPKASAFNVQLGLAYLQNGHRQRAKQKLFMALQESPESVNANDAIAYYFETTQEYDKAQYYYEQALHTHVNSGKALNNYGAFLCRQKQYEKAEDYFLKAATEPSYLNTAAAYENAGLCALSAHNTIKAKAYFQQALAQDPSLLKAREGLKRIY